MSKLLFIFVALLLIIFPMFGMDRKEDLLLYGVILLLEVPIMMLFFKRFRIYFFLVIPIAILGGLICSTIFWVAFGKLGLQESGLSQQQEILGYLLMISFALISASHIVMRFSHYIELKKYFFLTVNTIFSLIYCVVALSYWP